MKKHSSVVLILTLSLFVAAASLTLRSAPDAAASGWKAVGPDGGDILAQAETRLNPTEIYALATNNFGQVFRTLNGGASWKRMAWINDFVYDIACDPRNPGNVYVLWMNGVYKSIDKGAAWTKYSFPTPHSSYGRIAVSPKNSSIVYVTGNYVTSQASWKTCMAVFKSNNGGRTWSFKPIIPASSQGQARALAVDPGQPATLYVGGWYTSGSYRDGLFKSRDGGSTWTDITGAIVEEPKAIVIDPTNTARLYVGTIAGVYASADGGRTWTKGKGIEAASVLAVDPSNAQVLYAGYERTIYRTADRGANWTTLPATVYGSLSCFSLSPGRMFYGSTGGLYRSTDAAASWTSSHKGIKAVKMGPLVVSKAAPGTLIALVPSRGIMKSPDSGATWEKLPDFERSRSILKIALHPTNAKIIYALAGGPVLATNSKANPLPSIYKTLNGGLSWSKALTGNLADLELSPKNPSRVFAAGKAVSGSGDVMAFFKSVNGGKTWTTHTIYASPNTHIYDLAVDPSNDNILYVGGDQGVYTKLFMKSSDGGTSWANLSSGLAGVPVGTLVFDPADSRRIYNVHSVGIYRSEDGGSTWAQLKVPDFQAEAMVIDPDSPNVLYAGGYSGVRMSADSGATWSDITGSLPLKYIPFLALDPTNRFLFAGTNGAGIYKKTL
jgi:photosystem II stability/assembly factor-like uncharacterized protein